MACHRSIFQVTVYISETGCSSDVDGKLIVCGNLKSGDILLYLYMEITEGERQRERVREFKLVFWINEVNVVRNSDYLPLKEWISKGDASLLI